MSISKKFEFDRVMKFALGNESSDGMYINEATGIEDILDAPIEHINVAFLSGGRDHHGAQTVEQHDSLNHAVLYLHVYQARQAQFGMENSESAPKVAVSHGVLTVKFQALRGNAYASGILKVLFEANCTSLNVECEQLGWKRILPKGPTAAKRESEIERKSLARLQELCLYTSHGEKRKMPLLPLYE
ncbi:hypothetical protein MMC31_003233, partial [Peltigera leucophlebia]|nr:hypothetical protein [Peltigera leucophlebia]